MSFTSALSGWLPTLAPIRLNRVTVLIYVNHGVCYADTARTLKAPSVCVGATEEPAVLYLYGSLVPEGHAHSATLTGLCLQDIPLPYHL